MAIRERAGRKSPWQVYWNNPITGKRESENFLTKKEAEKHDSLIKHRIKFDRESFAPEQVEEEPQSELTLEAAYLMYLKQKQFSKKGLSWQLDCMRKPLERFGSIPARSISRQDIQKLMDEMLATSVKPVTVRARFSVLRTVLRWSAAQGLMPPVEFPTLPPAYYEKFIPPTPDEIAAILRNASPHIFRVIVIGSQLGTRVGPSELLRLTWDDVDLERGILRVHGAKKNLKSPWREVPIRKSLLPMFEEWREEDLQTNASFLIHWRGKPVDKIKRAWVAALRRAGITRRIRPYDLRHAFATELIACGTDIGTVAKLMGHNSPTMIFSHYQHVMDSQKRSAVESLPDIEYVSKAMCPKNKALTTMQ